MLKQKFNYIGSKYSLLNFLDEIITQYKGDIFADIFAGTSIVSRHFKDYKIITNDIEKYSYIISSAYLKKYDINKINDIIEKINDGINFMPNNYFMFENYSENGKHNRLYFSESNGKKIDVIRQYIDTLYLTEFEKNGLICSLMQAADKVSNCASVYGAFLKKLKKSAQKKMILEPINNIGKSENVCYNMDANEVIKKIKGDILYLDPPYNHRQYSQNYHILNTIALYDNFEPRGITGQRNDNYSSNYSKKSVGKSLDNLIENSDFKYIFMSYNNEGILTFEDIKSIFEKYGKYEMETTEYRTYKSDNNRNNKSNNTIEYLHILKK